MSNDAFLRLIRNLTTSGWALFLPGPFWQAHKMGLLPQWGLVEKRGHRYMTDWQVLQFAQLIGLPVSLETKPTISMEEAQRRRQEWSDIRYGDVISLPEPTFTNTDEWEEMLRVENLESALGKTTLVKYDGSIFEVSFRRITLGFASSSKEEMRAKMQLLRQTLGTKIQRPDERNIRGYIAFHVHYYGRGELVKMRRRIEDLVRKDNTAVVRVAKFLKLK